METPIFDFVQNQISQQTLRFFMPGHKGKTVGIVDFAGVHGYDITEINGADQLYQADGIIAASEQNAAALFGAAHTCYSTQGSTLGVQTMLYLARERGNTILAGRGVHESFIRACMLLNFQIVWLLSDDTDSHGICGSVSPAQIAQAICKHPDAAAVYVTSIDYLGNAADIKGIASVCHSAGVPLLCDNAHGAYLKWGRQDHHPISKGAALCCDSAHKTLPVLTGGAYLHLGEHCPWSKSEVKQAMRMFGSTSPSYLTLISLDLCNQYLYRQAQLDFTALSHQVKRLKQHLGGMGIVFAPNPIDYAKLTLRTKPVGYTGDALAAYLRERQIECEYANSSHLVLLLSPFHDTIEWERLIQALEQLPRRTPLSVTDQAYRLPEAVFPAYEIRQYRTEYVRVGQAEGRICGEVVAACPPGVPVAIPGERLNKQLLHICKSSGNHMIKVIK